METSSESDSYDRTRSNRSRGCEAPRRAGHRDRGRARGRAGGSAGGSRGEGRGADMSEKISTLASTLQDTSKNLTKVDRMLGQYRDHTEDQAEAMALLRENLEESISHLQTQRLGRSNGVWSASVSGSPLHTSDLEACSGSETQRFYPTSPLKDYTGTRGRRRRSHSASVRFSDEREDIHTMHQSLRDLRCDQQRLSDDLDREILRRNRSDIGTRRAMETLVGHMTTSQTQAATPSRVEQRLQELEREMRADQRGMRREGRSDQRTAVSDELQETSERHQIKEIDQEEAMKAELLKAEKEKSKVNQELERSRRLLEQSEDSRESLVQEVQDLHVELLRMKKEKTELQRARLEVFQPVIQSHGSRLNSEEGGNGQRGPDTEYRGNLEKEVAELRAQLRVSAGLSEVEELKRALERKEKERVQLSVQVEEMSLDLARREQQQLRMLEQLRDIQSRGQAERRETEALLQESMRTRDELKTRAQEAVRQWRAKCRRLQKELEEAKVQAQFHTDKASQAAKERENSQAQLKALNQQTEAARKELADILGRLAQREEELHCKDVELSENRQRMLSLEQEIREVKVVSAGLEDKTQHQADLLARLEEENQKLEERANTQFRRNRRDLDAHAELQAALKQRNLASAQLSQQLAEEERSKKEFQVKLVALQEERVALGQQLQLEREVHQKELHNMKSMIEDSRTKKDREVQEMLRLCQQERDETQAHLSEVKTDAAADKELCGALRIKLDRMKYECDKLAVQLGTKEEAHALLLKKYYVLKQQLDDKVRSGERKRTSEAELAKLEEKVSRMEAEQEAVLSSMGEELDAACRSLARNGEDKLQAISQKPGLVKDPHRWLAETKTKLSWLCEEVQESNVREQRQRKQHQQTRDQLKALRKSRDSEQKDLLKHLDQQEKQLQSVSAEKRELLERSRRKEEELRSLQDRVLDLETNTRVALDHLEAIPEKQDLVENFKDLEESQRQREMADDRYTKYKEIVSNLQHQLDESKRKIQEYKDEKLDTTSRSRRLAALSSSIKSPSTFRSSSLRSDSLSPHKSLTCSDLDDPSVNVAKHLS